MKEKEERGDKAVPQGSESGEEIIKNTAGGER